MDIFNENDENSPENGEQEPQVTDKRRIKINDSGDVEAAVSAEGTAAAKEFKSPETVRLETELEAYKVRAEAAESKLGEVQKRFEEAKNGLERETAEMRQRLMKTLEDRAREGQANFLISLLPVLDNLNLAIEHTEKGSDLDNLLNGVKGTARVFEQTLANVGVEQVPSIGTDFNPEVHDAIEMVESTAENNGKVTGEFSKGYKFGSRLLRPARVQVGKG